MRKEKTDHSVIATYALDITGKMFEGKQVITHEIKHRKLFCSAPSTEIH
jgi:hypothetical protein